MEPELPPDALAQDELDRIRTALAADGADLHFDTTPLRPEDRVNLPALPVREGSQFPPLLPAEFFGEKDGRRWHLVARESSALLVRLTDKPYAYPEEGPWEEFARGQLAEVAAAALWELLAHAMDTDDEHHLEAFVKALTGADRIPAEVAAAIDPILADLLPPILGAIKNARTAERSES